MKLPVAVALMASDAGCGSGDGPHCHNPEQGRLGVSEPGTDPGDAVGYALAGAFVVSVVAAAAAV